MSWSDWAHYFGINPIWAEMGGRESTNFMELTTLYYKMTYIFLTLLRIFFFWIQDRILLYPNLSVYLCKILS